MGEEEVVDGGIFDDFLATSTVPPRLTTTTTTAPPIEISTSGLCVDSTATSIENNTMLLHSLYAVVHWLIDHLVDVDEA